MKKRTIIFIDFAVILGLLAALAVLIINYHGGLQNIFAIAIIAIFLGYNTLIAVNRIKSLKRKEPCADELSKKIMTKASSIAFYISVFFWVFLLFISDTASIDAQSLIETGIMGMSLIFICSLAGVRFLGYKIG